ncbi:MAG: SMC-Scp complex subunit ScpB [Thermoguttaceae bacterium]|nr:SMC-Scp complex subunit ScpB [Thermoguttaceae bacterium]MDO4424481.1 SMC-Scp complex subunit ScpB [Planctomycetia bacterium]
MSSDELSFEELSQAFARVMKGNSGGHANDEKWEGAHSGAVSDDIGESVEIPDEFLGEDFPEGDFEEGFAASGADVAVFDENALVSGYGTTDFRSFMDEIDDDHLVPTNQQTILEAMLFVGNPGNSPIAPEHLSNLMRGVSEAEIHELVDELNARYEKFGCPWQIVWFEEEKGYFMQLKEEFSPLREHFYGKIRQAKLSQAAIDILAIVAYEQPLTLEEINQLRGSSSGGIIAQLVRRQLLRTQKMRQGTKFVTVYFTTDRFLKLFELESISDLPQSEDLDRE